MICPKCGASNAEGARFCTSCGTAMGAASDGTPPPGSAAHTSGIPDFAKTVITPGLIARVKNIIMTPATEWPAIDAEASTPRAIYMQYVAPLAAIAPICGFIGRSIIGINTSFFGSYRVPIVTGLVSALLAYALTFVGVFVVALIIDALAPTFGGQKDSLRALKVAAYSSTPAWLAGVFQILPAFGLLGVIGGLYGLYLLYLGLPLLMRSAKDKAIAYTAVTCVCAIVLYMIIGALSGLVVGGAMMGLGPHVTVSDAGDGSGGGASFLTSLFGGKTAADQQRVAIAMQTLNAQNANNAAAGDGQAKPVDASATLNAFGTIMSGGSKIKPVDFHALKAMLPDSLPGMKRTDASGETAQAMGFAAASATAHYSDGAGKSVTVEIADLGSMSGLAGLASKFDPNLEKETDTGYERTTHVNGQLIHEQYDNRSKYGEVDVIAGNRFSVSVKGNGVDMDVLTDVVKQFDLPKLASLGAGN